MNLSATYTDPASPGSTARPLACQGTEGLAVAANRWCPVSQRHEGACSVVYTVMDDARTFERLYPSLRQFAAVVSGLGVDPDDLVQEAVARTLRLGPLSALDDPASYLRRAILNLVRNEHRATDRRTRLAHRQRADEGVSDVYPSDFVDLSELTVDQRAVLYLRYVDQLSISATAQLLGLTEEAVRARTARAMKTLRVDLRRSPSDEIS